MATGRCSTSATSPRGSSPPRSSRSGTNVNPAEVVKLGERIEALVLNKEDEEGRLIPLQEAGPIRAAPGIGSSRSPTRAGPEGPGDRGGQGRLIVDIGLRGFLPASLVELRRVRDLDLYVGQEIEAKVIELDRNRNNVVPFPPAYLEEEQAEQRQAFLDQLQVGEVRQGVVSFVVPSAPFRPRRYGRSRPRPRAPWQHVNHPGEVVKVETRSRSRCSRWTSIGSGSRLDQADTRGPLGHLRQGEQRRLRGRGRSHRTVPFGAFVSVATGSRGWCTSLRFAAHRVDRPSWSLDRSACPGQGHRDGGGAPTGEPVDQAGAARLVGAA